jgi:hypothetical protein
MNFIELVFILSWSGSVLGQCSNNKGRVRLEGGGERIGEGRLEVVDKNGRWSSVCPDNWATRNAGVACEELCGERKYAASLPAKGRFGPILNPIRIFNTKCVGYENSLVDCPHNESDPKNCYEDTAVGLCCHSGCNGRNLFLAPRLRYSASCDYRNYTVTVEKPQGNGPRFSLWPNNKPDCLEDIPGAIGANATHNWITVPYVGDCDLNIDINDKDFIKYNQKVLIKGQSIGPSVSRLYQFLLSVTCGVNRNTNKTAWLDASPPQGGTEDLGSVNGSVNLDMIIKVYKDPNFTQEHTSDSEPVEVGTPFYVELSIDKDKLNAGSPVTNSKLLVEYCVAIPFANASDSDDKAVIIKDKISVDDSTDILRSPAFNKARFRLENFKILNYKAVYLRCTGYVCPLSDNKKRCIDKAALYQHLTNATKVSYSTATSTSGQISVEFGGYEVPEPDLKKKPIYDDDELPGLGPKDIVKIGVDKPGKPGKCYLIKPDGSIRLYHNPNLKPTQSPISTKAENPCLNQA